MSKNILDPLDFDNEVVLIDVDVIIEEYNKANPDKLQLSRKILAKILGVNTQLFTEWKNNGAPAAFLRFFRLMEIGKCKHTQFTKVTQKTAA